MRWPERLLRRPGRAGGRPTQALRGDVERERELDRQRMAFFSAASHELKTPVTILKGQLTGMLEGVGVYRDRDKYLAPLSPGDGADGDAGGGAAGHLPHGAGRRRPPGAGGAVRPDGGAAGPGRRSCWSSGASTSVSRH
ncbi:MAG: hypothetical protein ACLSE4_15695 [Clostridium sp.]